MGNDTTFFDHLSGRDEYVEDSSRHLGLHDTQLTRGSDGGLCLYGHLVAQHAAQQQQGNESDDEYGPADAAPGTDLREEFIRRRNMKQRCIGVGYL